MVSTAPDVCASVSPPSAVKAEPSSLSAQLLNHGTPAAETRAAPEQEPRESNSLNSADALSKASTTADIGPQQVLESGRNESRRNLASNESKARKQKSSICDDCCYQDGKKNKRKREKDADPSAQLEFLIEELFRAHDLNEDNFLDENELIKINEAVAEVHEGNDSETVRAKFSKLFREKLDPQGQPVPYAVFRTYILEMLDSIDQHEEAQEMMVEQFIVEARLARTVVTGDPLLVDRPRPQGFYRACLSFCPLAEAGTEIR
jgi:hypothetical protein